MALVAGEAADRMAAKDKGSTARDKGLSAGGGCDAGEKWAALKKQLVEAPGNFALAFEQRYIVTVILHFLHFTCNLP